MPKSRPRTVQFRWGPHTFDRFTNDTNKQLSPFSSYFWCPGTAGLDAFSFDWGNHNNWINPPFSLTPKLIAHLRLCQAAATVLPTSICFNVATICSTENRFFFTANSLPLQGPVCRKSNLQNGPVPS